MQGIIQYFTFEKIFLKMQVTSRLRFFTKHCGYARRGGVSDLRGGVDKGRERDIFIPRPEWMREIRIAEREDPEVLYLVSDEPRRNLTASMTTSASTVRLPSAKVVALCFLSKDCISQDVKKYSK